MIYVDIYVQKKSIEIPSSLDGKKRNEIDFLTTMYSSHEERVYRPDIHPTVYSSHQRYFIPGDLTSCDYQKDPIMHFSHR